MTVASVGNFSIWFLIAILSVGVGGYALFQVATSYAHVADAVMNNHNFTPIGIETHIAAAGVAMITGAFQFSKTLRRKAPVVHRWTGYAYVTACTMGGLAGGLIALGTTAGPIAGWGFLMLAVLWVPFTLLALAAAMRKDFVSHERWMIRSFALTFGAVTLRLYLPMVDVLQMDFLTAYRAIAWLAWVPNLIVAELYIASLPRLKRRTRPPVATAEA